MTDHALSSIQRAETLDDLSALAMACKRRFVESADLLQLRGPIIKRLRDLGVSESVDYALLFPAWKLMCTRYNQERYDPQATLFEEPQARIVRLWRQFVRHELMEALVADDELVRNVLRVLGALPCRSQEDVARTVCQYFADMTLPYAKPAWGIEEMTD